MIGVLESWTGLTFLDPWMLWLAGLLPLSLWLRRRGGVPAVGFAPAVFARPPVDGGARSWPLRLRILPRVLQTAGLLLVVVALARPAGRDPLPLTTEGIDILLCLDISSSMRATDMDAGRTRLEVAKSSASAFVSARPDDRIGLVCFARYPDLRCPPTLDHRALQEFLGSVELVDGDGPEDATGIGTAVARASHVLRSSAAKSKVVILLTDGEENVATEDTPGEIAPVHAAQLCKELDVRVYTIAAGVGRRSPTGGLVPLDTRQVERVASKTGGRFFAARDAAAVEGVYAAIDRLEKVTFDEPRFRIVDRFLPFLLAAVTILLGARVLQSTKLEVLP